MKAACGRRSRPEMRPVASCWWPRRRRERGGRSSAPGVGAVHQRGAACRRVPGFRREAGPGTVTVEVQDASTTPPRPLQSHPSSSLSLWPLSRACAGSRPAWPRPRPRQLTDTEGWHSGGTSPSSSAPRRHPRSRRPVCQAVVRSPDQRGQPAHIGGRSQTSRPRSRSPLPFATQTSSQASNRSISTLPRVQNLRMPTLRASTARRILPKAARFVRTGPLPNGASKYGR